MRLNSTISRRIATTTTHAPSTNLVTRKMIVATAVTVAPTPLISALRDQLGPRVRRQWTTRPDWAMVKPMNTPMANRGMSELVFPFTATSRAAENTASAQTPLPKTCRLSRQAEEVGQVVVASQQAGEDREPAEGCVCRKGQDQRDGEGHDVVGPVAADGVDHDLAQYGLPGTRLYVELVGEEGQAEQHHPQDGAEQQLGSLGPDHAGLTEERDAVGDCFDTGKRAAAGRERLEHQ